MIASKLKLVSILLFLLSILIGNGVIQAKVEESITFPSFVNFKPNASSVVLCMTTDADGQIWMGTDKGLVVYDGYRDYTLFRGTDLQTIIHTVMLAGDKVLMGTDGGLRIAERRNLRVLPSMGGVRSVRALLQKGTKIMVGGADGVDVYDIQTGSTHPLVRNLPQVYSLLNTPYGLLVGTLHGLYIIHNKRVRAINVGIQPNRPLINAMAHAKDGGYWIGTEGALFHYDGHSLEELSTLHSNSIKALCQVNDILYIGTDDGLYMVDNMQHAVHVCQDIRVDNSLASNVVWSLTKDKWNNLLVGTDRGLSVHRSHEPFRCWSLSAITGRGDGNTFETLLSDADGMSLWVGGDNGLINMHRSAQGWKVSKWYRQGDLRWNISHNRIRKLHHMSDGTIIACTDHGLFIIDPRNGTTRNVLLTDGTGQYNAAWAYDIVEDRNKRCWVSAYAGGIFIIDRHRLLVSQGLVRADAHLGPSLIGVNIGSLAIDRQGRVWAAAYSGGVDRIDVATLHVTHAMKESSVDKVIADAGGSVWVTMAGKVVRFANGDIKSHRTFSMVDRGLLPVTLGTEDGALWIAANKDVCILRPDGSSKAFSLNTMNAFSMASPLSWTDHAGKRHKGVILGGEDVLMTVSTENLATVDHSYLQLTGIEVNGQQMCMNEAGQYLENDGKIILHSNENNFKLLFSDNPQCGRFAARYAYLMEGVGEQWTLMPAGTLQVAFNGLPHGSYRLRVSVVDGQGRPSKEIYSLKVTILPPWYLTWWTKTIYVLLFLSLISWAVRFVWIRRELQRERKARNDAMEQSARRAEFFATLSEKLKMSAASVLASVFNLQSQFHGKQEDDINIIRRNGTAICQMASEALDLPLPTANNTNKTVMHRLDLTDLCQLVVSDYHDMGRGTRMSFSAGKLGLMTEVDVVAILGLLDAITKFVDDDTLVKGNAVLSTEEKDGNAVLRLDVEKLVLSIDKRHFAFMSHGESHLTLISQRARIMGAVVSLDESEDGFATFIIKLGYKVDRHESCSDNSHSDDSAKLKVNTENTGGDNPKKSEKGFITLDVNDEDVVVKAVTAMIEEHLADADLNVQLLTQLTGYGTKLIYRRIKAVTGLTPVNYIRQMRMQRAAVFLKQGRFAVSEVMYMVGFSTQSYFAKCFNQTFGMSPAEYSRRNIQS